MTTGAADSLRLMEEGETDRVARHGIGRVLSLGSAGQPLRLRFSQRLRGRFHGPVDLRCEIIPDSSIAAWCSAIGPV